MPQSQTRSWPRGIQGWGKPRGPKKIAWDWGKKNFNKVSIVVFLHLKFIHPDVTLESAMIEQIPELEGLHITPSKIESFLEHFGERCLLILDGLDEHALGSNKDVLKVLQHRKYLNCNIVLTSRPHSTSQIQQDFHTLIGIEGFTRGEARKFAMSIVQDEKTVEQIIDYNPTGDKQKIELCKCPILLSFMCILVRENAIDLANKAMPTGEIYTRMIQCLYKKFTIRRKIKYDDGECIQVVRLVGKIAWETLLLGYSLFDRSRVETDVGKEAFDYGFLIGNEDLIGDVKADILITFAHRSIQEFFGAFFFVLQLIAGKDIDSLLGDSHKDPIFMKNHLFLHFCFWFLTDRCNREYFPVLDMKTASNALYADILERIQSTVLNPRNIAQKYPVINFVRPNDEINAENFGRILEMLDKVQCLMFRHDDPIDWILNHVQPDSDTLALIAVGDDLAKSEHNIFPEFSKSKENGLNIVLSGKACKAVILKCLLEKVVQWNRQPVVHLFLSEGNDLDLSEGLHRDMHELPCFWYSLGTS